MELQAITGQLDIRSGEPQVSRVVNGLWAQAAPKRTEKNRRQDYIFVHLTLNPATDSAQDSLTQDLVDEIVTQFYNTAGSVNSALRQAIRQANQLLINWNMSHSGERREGAITCAVLRQDELFIMQAGPALAILGHNFGLERFPPQEPVDSAPLGQSVSLSFQMAYQRLQTGDMLMLAEPSMVAYSTQVLQPALVDTEVEIGLNQLIDIVGTGSARVMLIEFTDDPPPEFPDTDLNITMFGGHGKTRQILPLREMNINTAEITKNARRGAATAAIGVSKLTDTMADALEQVTPAQVDPAEEENNGWAIPTSVAILIPILVAIILTSVFLQRENTQRMSVITQEMGQALALAEESQDVTVQRTYYLAVLELGREANEIRPQDSEVLNLQASARQELDRLENITRLNGQVIHSVDDEEAFYTSITLGDPLNGDFYVLDSGLNQVVWHQTEENYLPTDIEPEVIVFTRQVIQNHAVGTPLDMIWRPRGNSVSRDGIAILDGRGALITFYPNFSDTRAVQLGLSSGWRAPSQIKEFSERVYILDGQAGYVWRYFPNGDELTIQQDDQAISFFDEVNMNQVVDFAINASDGTVVLLFHNGQLVRYADGRSIWPEGTLADGGLTAPMLQPTAVKIVGQGTTASIFVLDPGSQRLLQFAMGGRLLAQYRATDENGQELFANATDFDIAESPFRVFITAGNSVYTAGQQ